MRKSPGLTARCHWVTQTVVWALFHGRWASPGPAPPCPQILLGSIWGVLLHSTDPRGSLISDTQPESTHCHKHNELIQESTEGGAEGPLVPEEPQLFLINPHHLRPACPPRDPLLPCCSTPASAQPGGSEKGFLELFLSCAIYSGDSQTASRQCRWRAAREGQCPDRGVGLRLPHLENCSGAPTSFLPSGPVSAQVWSLPDD